MKKNSARRCTQYKTGYESRCVCFGESCCDGVTLGCNVLSGVNLCFTAYW